MNRREALRTISLSAIGFYMVACGQSQPDSTSVNRDVLLPEKQYSEMTFEESLRYIQEEINKNQNLESLYAYGDKQTRAFVGHSYNIFRHATGSAVNVDEMLQNTILGVNSSLSDTFIHGAPPPSSDLSYTAGRTYPNKNNLAEARIMVNKDAYVFQRPVLLNTIKQNPQSKIYPTVLHGLLDVAIHEPFHYESGFTPLDPKLILKANSTFAYDVNFGFSVSGSIMETGRRVENMGPIDELSIFQLQRKIIEPRVGPLYRRFPGYSDNELDVVSDLFGRVGYPTPEEMLGLRRRGKGFVELLATTVTHMPASGSFSANDAAFQFLVRINNELFQHTPPPQILGFIKSGLR